MFFVLKVEFMIKKDLLLTIYLNFTQKYPFMMNLWTIMTHNVLNTEISDNNDDLRPF